MSSNRQSAAVPASVHRLAGADAPASARRAVDKVAGHLVEELEELRLLDGQPGTPALRVVPMPKAASPAVEALYARARLLWPGLDARALSRCGGDPRRVARLVARRTVLTEEAIVELLLRR
jgi:hypothetical protein